MDYLLFSRKDTSTFFLSVLQKATTQIDSFPDNEIMNKDLTEWENYLFHSYYIYPIELMESKVTQSMIEEKIKVYNRVHYFGEPEYFMVDGVRITYKIPFDGDGRLFDLQPSTYTLKDLKCDSVVAPCGEELGYISVSLLFDKKDLMQHGNEMRNYVFKRFNDFFNDYRRMIEYVNDDVKSFNANLKSEIKRLLTERKNRADSTALISQKLAIPLYMNENAPNTKPIPLKRIKRTTVQKPQRKPVPTEYSIRDEDYNNINNIMYMCGSSMEKTARSYTSNDEEELRDIFLATLNTHYENASGETFRKVGKTDIHILFENQAAFIAECKIWRGEKVFTDAIQQLFNYSTWKDTKVTLIIFNKHNKSFQAILSKIDDWVKTNTKTNDQINANRWDCVFYRQDMEVDVKLHIVVFDLYVDESLPIK